MKLDGARFSTIGFPCFAACSASKFGQRGFFEALRRGNSTAPARA